MTFALKSFAYSSPLSKTREQSLGDEAASASEVSGKTNRPGRYYWKGLLESLVYNMTPCKRAYFAIGIVEDLLNLFCCFYWCELFCPSEHLGLALALNVPVFVVVTKIDMCPPNVLQDTMKLLARILKSPGCRKIPVIVQNTDDVVVSATNFVSERYVPQVS